MDDLLDRMNKDSFEKMKGLNYFDSNDIIMIHDNYEFRELFVLLIEKLLEKVGFEVVDVRGSYFGRYGAGFTTMPVELGGQMPGGQSRFGGAPMA